MVNLTLVRRGFVLLIPRHPAPMRAGGRNTTLRAGAPWSVAPVIPSYRPANETAHTGAANAGMGLTFTME